MTVKDAKITHLSTWIIAKDPSLIQIFSSICGEDAVPISIKVRFYGEEKVLKVYNNMLLEELMRMIEALSSIELKKQSVKVIEDTVIRRVDR